MCPAFGTGVTLAQIWDGVNLRVYGVSRFRYSVNMESERRAKALTNEIARILAARAEELGYSLRKIELESGISRMSVQRALNAEHSIPIDKLDAIAAALGLDAWKVLKTAQERVAARVLLEPAPKAEGAIRTPAPAATIDPATYAKQAEAKLAQLLKSNYVAAAKHHTPDPYANLGEENQESDK